MAPSRSDSEKLDAIIAGIDGIAEILRIQSAMLRDLSEWLREPAGNELPTLLAQLVANVGEMRRELREMPAKVARAVKDGEIE